MKTKTRVYFSSHGAPTTSSEERWVRTAAHRTLKLLPASTINKLLKRPHIYPLYISFVSLADIRRLNARYRKKNRPTDVLAFPRLKSATPSKSDIGDVVLCPSVAKVQAKRNGVSNREELQRLTIHGVLHLFGYDHEKSSREAKRMFRLQEQILATL